MVYAEIKSVMDTRFEEGELSKAFKIAKEMKDSGESIEKNIKYTKLSIDEIDKL